MQTLLPSPEVLLAIVIGFLLIGLTSNSRNRLIKLALIVCVLHFTLIILLPYLFSRGPFPGGLVAVAIIAYGCAFGAAFIGYALRRAIARLFGRAPS